MLENDSGVDKQFAASVQRLAASATQRNWLNTIRPWSEFANPSTFTLPKSLSEAGGRLEINIPIFLSNYALIGMLTLVYGIIFKPLLLFLTVVIAALGYYTFYMVDAIKISDVTIRGNTKTMAFAAFSSALILIFAGGALFGIFILFAAVTTIHGVLRDPKAAAIAASNGGAYSSVPGNNPSSSPSLSMEMSAIRPTSSSSSRNGEGASAPTAYDVENPPVPSAANETGR